MPRERNGAVRSKIEDSATGHVELETTVLTRDEKRVDLRWVVNCETSENTGRHKIMRGMMIDVTEQRRLENDLAQAQKLESVGRLAAGVAHEINTPVQFVSDSVLFVREAMDDLSGIVDKYRDLRAATKDDPDEAVAAAAKAAEEAEDDADLDYILENAPVALDRARDGLGRVAAIVRSMKEFAHPDRKEMVHADLNQAIASTLVIASNEYKYVAEVETSFGEIPPVNCYAGEVNQVVLNLIVNAAHAIADVVKGTPAKGRIRVSTRLLDGQVEIAIADSGKGIPVEVRSRIFDPFFTTKEVGKGTGQGLAIARTVVVDKHKGTLHFETELGQGTTFFIRLPVNGPDIPRRRPHDPREGLHRAHPRGHGHHLCRHVELAAVRILHGGDLRCGRCHQPQLHRAARHESDRGPRAAGSHRVRRSRRHHPGCADCAAHR